MSMTPHEQVSEALHAVRDAIDDVFRKGPLITREEAITVGTLMKMTAPTVLSAGEKLRDGVDYVMEPFYGRREPRS